MEKDLSEILSAQRMPQTLMLPKVERVEDIDMVYKGPVYGVIVLVCSYCTSIFQLYPLIVLSFNYAVLEIIQPYNCSCKL